MRHLNRSITSALDFIDRVISSKKMHKGESDMLQPDKMTYKERCAKIRKLNEEEIIKYDTAFATDNFSIIPQGVPVRLNSEKQDCEEMEGLYSFKCAEMGKLWTEVLTSDGYLNDLCPVCGALKATTYDHYLPKSSYQLFSVHPLNLIPCCTVCNGHKLNKVFDKNHKRLYWNAYLDFGIKEQYLFCEISEKNGMPMASFRVEKGRLPDRYFEILKNTFDDLYIAETYRNSSGSEIVRLKNSCCSYYIRNQDLGLKACMKVVEETIPDTDVNYWVNVLHKALISTDVFRNFVLTAIENEYGMPVK